MTDPRLAEDAAARLRALEPTSFVVEAPAGAGKTELLAQRTLRLLALADHPEEVVALTFTNKAATEMRDRILGSLEMAANGERPGDEVPHRQLTYDLGRAVIARDRERGWQLLAHPGRLAVTTLDALCGRLARQMPCLSRFGAQPGIADDAEPHYRSAARRTLALLEDEGSDADTVAAALEFLDNDAGRLERLLVALLARRDQWLPHTVRSGDAGLRAEAEAALAALVGRDLATAADLIGPRDQEALLAGARYAAAQLAATRPDSPIVGLETREHPLTGDLADLPAWQALGQLLLTNDGRLRARLDVRQGFPPTPAGKAAKAALQEAIDALSAAAGDALAQLREAPAPVFGDAEWATVLNFSRLLNLATAQLWLAFQEAGAVDFAEVALRAITALGPEEAPTDLALALDYRIRHLLVDEFQDTSPTQARLIAGLTRGWEPGDGRSLFLVGDPMQSIYRFRKADVGLFLKIRDAGLGNLHPERLRLFRNNRSRPAVVEWVNRVFPAVFPAVDEPLHGAVRYAPCLATRPAEEDSGVSLHPLVSEPGSDGDRLEAETLLALIRATRRERPEADIAVLVRARSHLDGLVAALRREAPDLRFQAVDTEPLGGRQAIQDILSLTHALFHLADRVHWLAILRAPWCGLTLTDLHTLAGDDFDATVWQLAQDEARLARLTSDGRRRLAHLTGVLAAALAHRGRSHPRRWIEGSWRALGGEACLTAAADRQDVAALFALMDTLAAERRFTAGDLETEARTLFAPPDPAPEARGLQLMTIHQAKGLEFDTVIIPGLHRRPRGDDPPLLIWDEVPTAEGELLLAAPLPGGADPSAPTAYGALRRLERERGRHEAERLFYVAVTRARRRLHLVGCAESGDEGPRPPASDSLLRLIWDAEAGAAFAAADAAAPPAPLADTASATFIAPLRRIASDTLPQARLAVPVPAASTPILPPDEEGGPADAAIGTLVHRCLELIARDGLAAWPSARIEGLVGAYRNWLGQRGLDARLAEAGSRRVVAAVTGVLASATGCWILGPHPESDSELALSSASNDGPVQHQVDRCFTADGYRWIVDYKTLRLPSGDASTLPARAARHRPQLERYAALFASDAWPLRLAVYFVEQDTLVELLAGEEKIFKVPASGFSNAP